MKKKILAFLLALSMVFSTAMPVAAEGIEPPVPTEFSSTEQDEKNVSDDESSIAGSATELEGNTSDVSFDSSSIEKTSADEMTQIAAIK